MYFNKTKDRQFLKEKSPIYGSASVYPDFNLEIHNAYGFREKREYQTSRNMALGCSYTYGVGVEREEAWPYILEKLIKSEVYNFGVGGASLDTMSRVASYWIPKLKPEKIFIALEFIDRIELFLENKTWGKITPFVPKIEHLFLEENIYVNFHKNINLLKSICRDNGTKMIIIHEELPGTDRLGSDKSHPGPNWHNDVANLFYTKFKEL